MREAGFRLGAELRVGALALFLGLFIPEQFAVLAIVQASDSRLSKYDPMLVVLLVVALGLFVWSWIQVGRYRPPGRRWGPTVIGTVIGLLLFVVYEVLHRVRKGEL